MKNKTSTAVTAPCERPPAGRPASIRRRILIVEDHPIVSSGMKQVLDLEPDLCACGQAHSSDEALKAIAELRPDAALVDVGLTGDCDGLRLTRLIRRRFPQVQVVVLSMHDEDLYAERALRAGAGGYVMKSEPVDVVFNALRKVLGGGRFVTDRQRRRLAEGKATMRAPATRAGMGALSDRELQVMRLTGTGRPTREIAQELGVSRKTVEAHHEHIKRKLGFRSATELTYHAVCWVNSGCRGLPRRSQSKTTGAKTG